MLKGIFMAVHSSVIQRQPEGQHAKCDPLASVLLLILDDNSVYALRVLRSRGLCDTALQHVYRSTVRPTTKCNCWSKLDRQIWS